ncbi:MAG: hypothetical protein BZ137_00550 [Methanosphaera sp. rholeuAM130]|nr:MAG: hypothetical protein BZ137_00550 [Methanosphaera sp. rholeuAM130]
MWTENLIDVRNDVNYLVKLIEDMRVDIKDFYNLELEYVSNNTEVYSNIASIESDLSYISDNTSKSNKTSNDDVVKAIEKLGTSVNNLDSKIDRNNELLSELINVMKEKQ